MKNQVSIFRYLTMHIFMKKLKTILLAIFCPYKKNILIILAFVSINFAFGQCDDVLENSYPDLCVVQDGDGSSTGGPVAQDVYDLGAGTPGTDGMDDIQVTMEAVVCNAGCGSGSTYNIGGCVGSGGVLGGSSGGGSDFGSIFNPEAGNETTCINAGGYVVVTIDFINGFYTTAAGFDLPQSSNNGISEGYEGTFGWVTAATDANGTALTNLPTVDMNLFCNYTSAEYGTTQMSDFVGANGTGSWQTDGFNAGATVCGVTTQDNGEDTESGETMVEQDQSAATANPNLGLNPTDIITQVQYVYFYSSTPSIDCDGDGLTAANSDPAGSWGNMTFCGPPPPAVACGACTEGAAGLVLTELSYNPSGTQGVDGDCEYIELFNSYSNAIVTSMDVTITLSGGTTATIPAGTTINPGEYIILTGPNFSANCTWATPPPAGTQIIDAGVAGDLNNTGETVTVTLACASDPLVDFTADYDYTPTDGGPADGSGSSVYFPLDGSGPLTGAPTPGSGDCVGCTMTEFTCATVAVCLIDPPVISGLICDDNGTPDDPNDDTYTFTVTVTGSNTNMGATNTFNDDMANIGVTYGMPINYGPFPITGGDITIVYTDADDPMCTEMVTAPAPAPCSVPVCDITNVVFTQNCTGNGEEYELCVTFDYATPGASGQFQIYLDPAGTGTPATIVAGPYNYTDYDAAIAAGEACFTIPVADYAGDATDLEVGLEVCVGDVDAPAPGTGLPPGSTPPPGGGIPTFACPQIYGILHNACAPVGGDEGPNEFVVIVNGADPLDVSSIVVDTPSGSDYDDFNTVTPPPSWTCPCCVYLDETGTVPAGGVIVATSAANISTLDFTSLCATAGTIYVLQDDGVGTQGHFSNSGPRATLLNLTGTPACDGITSYSYTNANGNDGDYTTFAGPDNPGVTAPGSTIGTPDPGNIDSTGECTPQIAPPTEVECYGCATLDETVCDLGNCPVLVSVPSINEIICSGSLGTLYSDWVAAVNAANPLDATQDPNGWGSIVFSLVADGIPGFPDPTTPTGIHNGFNPCDFIPEESYAYLLCDQGTADTADDTYTLISDFNISIYLPADVTPPVDPGCGITLDHSCTGINDIDYLLEYSTDGGMTYSATPPMLNPGDADITVTYQVTVAGITDPACITTGTYDLTCPMTAVCEITGLTATPLCNADGTYCLTVDLTVTTPGASGQYTLDINGTAFGPYNYADLPQTMICDPSFIGDAETGISVTATDVDNAGGTGGLYISSVLADPNMVDGNGSGTVDSCDEYIVITNSSANPIDVSGYEIWDDASGGTPRYTIPAGTIIPPGGTLVIYTSDIMGMADGCTGVWNNGGDVIYLYSDSGITLVDSQTYPGAADDEIITFMDPNGGGMACTAMITFDELNCAIAECPIAAAPIDANPVVCSDSTPNGFNTFAAWETDVLAANPLDATQDPNGWGSLIFSGVVLADPGFPGVLFVDGIHNGINPCDPIIQEAYAYLICDQGTPDTADDTYTLIGTFNSTIHLPAMATPPVDPGCGITLDSDCANANYEVTYSTDGGNTYSATPPMLNPGDADITVTYLVSVVGITDGTCTETGTYDLTCPMAPVCEITGLTATPVCNVDGTYCLTVDLTVTTPGATGQYTLDINGTTFGPYNYADLPEMMICDPSFIGDGETGISVTATDADNTGGAGGLYISSVLADPNMADGNGSGTVDSCDEYIVITNSSANPIDVSGYEVWDDASGGTPRYTIPAGTIIPPGGTLIIYTSDIAGMPDGCTGVWNNGGDVIYLYSDSGVTLVDSQTYSGVADDEVITFMDPNGGGGMACSAMITFDELDCMQMTTCPVAMPASATETLCSGDPTTALADWQAAVDAANPLDIAQDPDGLGTILYSSIPDDMSGTWMPDGDDSGITGVHSGANGPDVCSTENQILYAYLFCSSDNLYEEIGSLTVTVYPLIADAVTLNNDGSCCPSITVVCTDYLINNSYDNNGAMPDCSAETGTGGITFTIELAIDPTSGDCAFYEISGSYDCSVEACQITPGMATNIVCDDNGTPTDPSDDTFTFDITINGNSTFPGATNTFSDDQGNTGVAYGTTVSYGPFPISGGNITVNFTDSEQADCIGMMMAAPPSTCSNTGPCEDEISGTVFAPAGCDVSGIEVTVYDDMGNVIVTLTTDMDGVYDSTPTAYPCGNYTVELTNNIPQCYEDLMGETGPKPFVIDGDDDDTDTDGQNFMPNNIPTLSQWGLICLALLLMVYGSLMIGVRTKALEKYWQ